MKKNFIGYYSTIKDDLEEIWNSEETLFIYDTNCILNLYRCEDHTRDDILNVMKAISNRTWIPFQVGFEYQRNRKKIIQEGVQSLNKIKEQLQENCTANKFLSGNVKKHLYSSLFQEITELQRDLEQPINKFITDKIYPRIESKEKLAEHDFIRDKIDAIIGTNVGDIPSTEKINSINEQGEYRYKIKMPPGFKDDKKDSRSYHAEVEFQDKYGDLYLWFEIIDKAKDDKIKQIIFICDDAKTDWWFEYDGKKHGAQESLKTEICRKSNIKDFRLISQSTFLHEAKQYIRDVNVSDESVQEIESLSRRNISISVDDTISINDNFEHEMSEAEELDISLLNDDFFSDNFSKKLHLQLKLTNILIKNANEICQLLHSQTSFATKFGLDIEVLKLVEKLENKIHSTKKLYSLLKQVIFSFHKATLGEHYDVIQSRLEKYMQLLLEKNKELLESINYAKGYSDYLSEMMSKPIINGDI